MDTIISQASPASEPVTTRPSIKSPSTSEPAHSSKRVLPDRPVVTIQKNKTLAPFDFGNFWIYREILYFLIWRDIKVRYQQTLPGVVWVVMQPIWMTLIFTVFLGMLARVPTGGTPYPLLVFTGLLPWRFFSSAVIGCSFSLVVVSGNGRVPRRVGEMIDVDQSDGKALAK